MPPATCPPCRASASPTSRRRTTRTRSWSSIPAPSSRIAAGTSRGRSACPSPPGRSISRASRRPGSRSSPTVLDRPSPPAPVRRRCSTKPESRTPRPFWVATTDGWRAATPSSRAISPSRVTGSGRVLGLLLLRLAPVPEAAPPQALAAQKDLTVEDIFDPDRGADFGNPVTGLRWIDDGHSHWPRTDRRSHLTDHLRVDALSGSTEPLFDAGALESGLRGVAGVSDEQARVLAHQASYVMNGRRTALLVYDADDLLLLDFISQTLTRA